MGIALDAAVVIDFQMVNIAATVYALELEAEPVNILGFFQRQPYVSAGRIDLSPGRIWLEGKLSIPHVGKGLQHWRSGIIHGRQFLFADRRLPNAGCGSFPLQNVHRRYGSDIRPGPNCNGTNK